MSQNAIVVENLSKRYLIGHRSAARYKYTALRDVVAQEARNFARKARDVLRGRQVVPGDEIEEFWALKDVSFEVKQGEVLGIIGRNGAGKSTLLKILSRITEPTSGRIVLQGRVASLLEVGTGFHPELTGRENIFLNGAILGMTQREIRAKFDEIVDFAEVEKFLDTPVKHYSSGMYVRLAFAVAAHLEPEILVVDEVLAVGDSEFQKKCLGKMDEVSRKHGRTVLFVSHNIEATLRLCTRGVLLETGNMRSVGDIEGVVAGYLKGQSFSPPFVDLSLRPRPPAFSGAVRLASASAIGARNGWSIPFGEQLAFNIAVESKVVDDTVNIGIALRTILGFEVGSWTSKCNGETHRVERGQNKFRIHFRNLRLLPGQYIVDVAVWGNKVDMDHIKDAFRVEIVSSAEAASISAEHLEGVIVPEIDVEAIEQDRVSAAL